MAFPTVVAVGGVAAGTTGVTPTLPAGWAQNDIFVLVAETANEAFSTWPPTGWTEVPNPPTGFGTAAGSSGVRLHVAWKRATASESAPVLGDSGNHQVAQIVAIRGVVTTGNPWTASATSNVTSNASSVTWPSLTPIGTQSLFVYALGGNRDISSTTDVSSLASVSGNISSLTQRISQWTTSGAGGGIYLATGLQGGWGATEDVTATITPQTFTLWHGALQAEFSYAAQDLDGSYAITSAVELDLSPTYTILEGEPYAWFPITTGGDYTWAEEGEAGALTAEEELTVTYDLLSALNPVDPADQAFTYDLFNSVFLDFGGLYDIATTASGQITSAAEFPYGAVSTDLTTLYVVREGTTSDLVVEYDTREIVQKDDLFSFVIKSAVQEDYSPVFNVAGTAEADSVTTYQVISAVESDSEEFNYDITEAVTQDFTPLWTITTTPLTADAVLEVVYQTISSVRNEHVALYQIYMSSGDADREVVYQVKNTAEEDHTVTFQVVGVVEEDSVVTYQILAPGTAQLDVECTYRIVSPMTTVPNVIGFPYPKALKTLEQAGFVIGQITYQ